MREIVLHDLHVQVRHLLDALQDIQAAPPAVALHRIRRVGHQLQLPQHELRDHQHAVQKAGFRNVGDAPVDDHAGIQDLERFLGGLLAAKNAAQRRQVEHVALFGAYDQADVRHPQQQPDLHERNDVGGIPALRPRPAQHQRHEEGAHNPQHRSESRPDQPFQADLFQPHLEEDDAPAEHESRQCGPRRGRRLERV